MHKIFEMICACIWDLLVCRYVVVSVSVSACVCVSAFVLCTFY